MTEVTSVRSNIIKFSFQDCNNIIPAAFQSRLGGLSNKVLFAKLCMVRQPWHNTKPAKPPRHTIAPLSSLVSFESHKPIIQYFSIEVLHTVRRGTSEPSRWHTGTWGSDTPNAWGEDVRLTPREQTSVNQESHAL